MTTLRDVCVALLIIAAGFGLDLLLPRPVAVAAGVAAYVACLAYFARSSRRRPLPPRYFAREEPHLN